MLDAVGHAAAFVFCAGAAAGGLHKSITHCGIGVQYPLHPYIPMALWACCTACIASSWLPAA